MAKTPRLLASAAALFLAVAAQAEPDLEAGAKLFSKCTSCHKIGSNTKKRVGPNLNELNGRIAGSIEDFPYSKSMTMAGQEGLIWTNETLDAFLADPKVYIPKTRMSYRGMKDPEDRLNLIAYLNTFSANMASHSAGDPHDLDPAILALVGDKEYGEYLSGDCKTCHQADGSAEGIPPITGWPVDDFVYVMHAYKNKDRNHPVMQMMAGRLSNEEIAALAAYFADLEE
jgi:cytochrome c